MNMAWIWPVSAGCVCSDWKVLSLPQNILLHHVHLDGPTLSRHISESPYPNCNCITTAYISSILKVSVTLCGEVTYLVEVCALRVPFQLLLLWHSSTGSKDRAGLPHTFLFWIKTCARTLRPAHVVVKLTPSMWSHGSHLWRIHTLMSHSWNTMNRKDVLTHWSPVPSSGALWEEGGFSRNIYSDLFLSLARGPWEKTGGDKQWTIGFRDEQRCQRSTCHYGM